MDYRLIGRTGLRVSTVGFGCGNVGGLIIRGDREERLRAVARAIELGINYFDTAASYGDGQSEINLGAALRELGAHVLVGTKIRAPKKDIKAGVIRSVEDSLKRLGRDAIDLIQLHNGIGHISVEASELITPQDILGEVLEAFQSLQDLGKTQFYGVTGKGETEAIREVLDSGKLYSVQIGYNLLNPSAGGPVPSGFYGQDYGGLINNAARLGMGVLVIRVLAGGAISEAAERHPLASPAPAPIGTGRDYQEDFSRAKTFRFLREEGHVAGLAEAAVRFPLGRPEVSTVLVGFSSLEQVEQAAASAAKGPLPDFVESRLCDVWAGFTG